jgi:tetratricopeptide (TPR) repeat protein
MKRTGILIVVLTSLLMGQPQTVTADEYENAKKAAAAGEFLQALGHVRAAVAEEPQNIDRLRLAAEIYLEMEIKDTALSYARRVFEDDDEEASSALLLSRTLIESNLSAEACVMLKKFRRNNDNVELALAHVNALVAADSTSSAELVATTARQKYPKEADAYLALGNLYFSWKPLPVFDLAVQNYNDAIAINANLVQAHFNLAICYWRMGNRESDDALANEYFNKCLSEWAIVSKQDPKNARAWYEQGKIYYLAKRYPNASDALKTYRELRPLGTGEIMASWYLGESLYKQGMCDDARKHLEDAASRIDSLKPKVSIMLARCTFQAKKWSECVSSYASASAVDSLWEGMDYWKYGTALINAGDTAKSIDVMFKAAKVEPKQCKLMERFAFLLQSKKRYAASNEIYRGRLANCTDSGDAKIHVLIGNNFYADSLVDSAIASYERALSINPKMMWGIQRLGDTYLLRGDIDKGRTMLDQVIANAATTTSADEKRYAIAAVASLNGLDIKDKKWQSIVERSALATTIDPKSIISWLYLGIGHQGMGDKDKSRAAYQEVLKIDPNNASAKKNLQSLSN